MKKLIISVILCLCCAVAYAGTVKFVDSDSYGGTVRKYYVDLGAATGGDGTITTPWDEFADLTTNLTALQAIVDANEQLIINIQGTFDEQLVNKLYGTSKFPVIYQGYGTGGIISNSTGDGFVNRQGFGLHGDHIIIRNLSFIDCADSGIILGGVEDIKIQRVYISGSAEYGIELITDTDENDYIELEDVTLYDSTKHGLYMAGPADNLSLLRVTAHGNGWDGMNVRPGVDVILDSCVAYENSQDGFDSGGSAGNTGTATYRNCTAYDNTSGGFSAKSNDAATSNYITCLTYGNYEGIEVGNSAIANVYGCTIIDNDHWGYYNDTATSYDFINNIVDENGFSAAGGIQVSFKDTGSTVTSNYNVITENPTYTTIYDRSVPAVRTLAEWQTDYSGAYDQDSIGSDPTLNSEGQLLSGSPALNTGDVIPRVNDGGQIDLWDNVTDATPNRGAYQGEGE